MAVSDNKSVLLLLSVRLSVQGGAADIAALSTPSGQPFHVCPPDYAGPPLTGASTAVVNRDPKSGAKCGLSTLAVSLKHGRSGGAAEGTAVLVATEEWFKSDWGGPAAAAESLGKEFPHFPTVWLQDVAAGLVADERTFRCEHLWALASRGNFVPALGRNEGDSWTCFYTMCMNVRQHQ